MIYDSSVNEVAQNITKQITPPTPEPEAADLPAGAGGGTSAPPVRGVTADQLIAADPRLASAFRLAQVGYGAYNNAVNAFPTLEQYSATHNPNMGVYAPDQYANPATAQYARTLATANPQFGVGPNRGVLPALGSLANEAIGVAAQPASLLQQGISRLPAAGLPGTTLGTGGGGLTGYKGKTVGQSDPFTQFIEQSLPYILAPQGIGTAVFAASAPQAIQQNVQGVQSGQFGIGTAAKNLALQLGPVIAPELARLGIKTLPAAVEWIRSPEGQTFVQRLQSERGGIGTPPEEPGAGASEPGNVGPEGAPRPVGDNLPAPPEPTVPDAVSSGIYQIANKFRDMIATARKLGPEQAAMITEQKAQRVAGAAGRLEQGGGLEAFHESKSFLAGEYDKPTFEPLNIPAEDVNAMVDHIGMQSADYFDKLGALTAIEKATLGVKPQPNELDKLEMFLPNSRIKEAFQQQAMQGEARGIGGEKSNFPSDVGGTQMHLLESDPAYVAARQARDAARSAEIRARYQAEMDRIAAEQARLSEGAAQSRLLPAGGQQTHLADAINEAYVGALSDSGAPQAVQSRFTRVLQRVLSPLQLAKSIKTSFDIGWGGRNGWRLIPTSPAEWFRMYGRQFKALVSENAFEEMQAKAKSYPWFQRAQASERPLAFLETGTGNPATSGEEFMSPLARYIPGLSGSERAYVGPGNLMRAEVMDSNIRRAVKALGRPLNDAEFQALEDSLNNATLRGNTKWIGQTNAQVLASTLFSTKGIVSGPQFVMDFFRMLPPSEEISPVVRGIIAQRVAAYVAMGMSTLGLAAATGFGLDKAGKPGFVKIGLDPFSKSSFGTIDINGFRWNYWGQDQPLVRAAIQIGLGKQSPAEGLAATAASRTRLAKNLVASKIAPGVPTWLWDELANAGFDNNLQQSINTPKGVALFAGNQFAPIVGANPVQAFRDLGSWAAAPSFLAEVQGFSTSTFSNAPTPKQTLAQNLQKAGIPTLDTGSWQKFLAPLGPTSKNNSYAEFEKNWKNAVIQEDTAKGMSAGEAARDASTRWDANPLVQKYTGDYSAAVLNFWREHPDLLQQYVAQGHQPTKAEQQILDQTRSVQPVGNP